MDISDRLRPSTRAGSISSYQPWRGGVAGQPGTSHSFLLLPADHLGAASLPSGTGLVKWGNGKPQAASRESHRHHYCSVDTARRQPFGRCSTVAALKGLGPDRCEWFPSLALARDVRCATCDVRCDGLLIFKSRACEEPHACNPTSTPPAPPVPPAPLPSSTSTPTRRGRQSRHRQSPR